VTKARRVAAETMVNLPTPTQHDVPSPPAEAEATAEVSNFIPDEGLVPDQALTAPEGPGTALPDQAVEPPEDSGRGVGPVAARTARMDRLAEIQERQARWEASQAATAPDRPAQAPRPTKGYEPPGLQAETAGRGGWLLIAACVLLVLGATGGAGWYLLAGEGALKASDIWEEFDKDYKSANTKYKERFVRVTGRVKIYTQKNQVPRVFFTPPDGANWAIEFFPPGKEASGLKDGGTATVRGRLSRADDKTNVTMSNCTLEKPN
jgi:hypothetical protein